MILPLRLVVGVVFIMNGYSTLSHGYAMGVHWATIAPFIYLFGGLCLFFGFFTRWSALVMGILTLFYMFAHHFVHGFFVSGGGYEYHLVLLGATFTILISGGGKWSLESYLGIKGY